jgi:hypothetical protein
MKNILPARHPFRKLKSKFQIWPYDPEDDWWLEDLPVWPQNYSEPESDFVLDWTKPGHQYLGGRQMHDSPVHSISWDTHSCEIAITDFEAWRLSTALNDGRLNPSTNPFPLMMRFHDPIAVCAWVDTPMGNLWKLKHNLDGVLESTFEYIGDLVTRWTDDEFVGYFEFRYSTQREFVLSSSGTGWYRSRTVHIPSLILAIHCRKVEFVEGQEVAMRRSFGERGVEAFRKLNAHRYFFSQGSFMPFVDLAERGVVPSEKLP